MDGPRAPREDCATDFLRRPPNGNRNDRVGHGEELVQVDSIDESGQVVLRRKLARAKVLQLFAGLTPCVIGLEACGGAHFWTRELIKLGHDARQMPARYVRVYVKTNKHDAAYAEACCEAIQRPGMRFVPVNSEEQQGMLMIHRSRDLLVCQRTAAVNALCGHLAEFGITTAKGTARARELMSLVDTDEGCADDRPRRPSATGRPNSRHRAQDRGFRQADPVARAGE